MISAERRSELLAASAAAALALAAAAWVLELWEGGFSRPFEYAGDALWYEAAVKGLMENGWHLHNPDLAAPFGTHMQDFPVNNGETLHMVILKVLAVPFDSAFTVVNLFYVLTFPLCALTAYLVLRHFGGSRGTAIVASVLFALAPYHFQRGEGHLFLAAYYTVPLACWLVLSMLRGDELFARRQDPEAGRLARFATRRTGLTVLVCALVASASSYYAAFTLMLVAIAALLRGLARRERKHLPAAVVVLGLVSGVMLLNQVPSFIYWAEHGRVSNASERSPGDADAYGLKLTQLVTPVPEHRLDPLDRLGATFERETEVPSERMGNLGIVTLAGAAWLLLVALAGVAARGSPPFGRSLERDSGAALLVAVLIGTIGGLGAIFAYLVTPQVRGWDRISIFIAFFAVIGVMMLLERVREGMASRPDSSWARRGLAFPAVLAAVLLVGLLDQTSPAFTPDRDRIDREYASDAGVVHELERVYGRGARVFILPIREFPSNSPGFFNMRDFDHLRGYLHSRHLSWSYGATAGRPEDWQEPLRRRALPLALDAIAASGFAAVYVDTFAYQDPSLILGELDRRLGAAIASQDGRFRVYDLRPFARRLEARLGARRFARLGEAALHPVSVSYDDGFTRFDEFGPEPGRWAEREAKMTLDNSRDEPARIRFSTIAYTRSAEAPVLTLTHRGRVVSRTTLPSAGAAVRVTLVAPPGGSEVTFRVSGPSSRTDRDPRDVYARLVDSTIVDDGMCVAGGACRVETHPAHVP